MPTEEEEEEEEEEGSSSLTRLVGRLWQRRLILTMSRWRMIFRRQRFVLCAWLAAATVSLSSAAITALARLVHGGSTLHKTRTGGGVLSAVLQ
jgi:hypothetical protein